MDKYRTYSEAEPKKVHPVATKKPLAPRSKVVSVNGYYLTRPDDGQYTPKKEFPRYAYESVKQFRLRVFEELAHVNGAELKITVDKYVITVQKIYHHDNY